MAESEPSWLIELRSNCTALLMDHHHQQQPEQQQQQQQHHHHRQHAVNNGKSTPKSSIKSTKTPSTSSLLSPSSSLPSSSSYSYSSSDSVKNQQIITTQRAKKDYQTLSKAPYDHDKPDQIPFPLPSGKQKLSKPNLNKILNILPSKDSYDEPDDTKDNDQGSKVNDNKGGKNPNYYPPNKGGNFVQQLPASKALNYESIGDFDDRLIDNGHEFEPETFEQLFGSTGGSTGDNNPQHNLVQLQKSASTSAHSHIMDSHSESGRNAVIYIAVILFCYFASIAFISVQYYRKHSTLDPVMSFIFGQNRSKKKNKKKRNKNHNGDGNGSKCCNKSNNKNHHHHHNAHHHHHRHNEEDNNNSNSNSGAIMSNNANMNSSNSTSNNNINNNDEIDLLQTGNGCSTNDIMIGKKLARNNNNNDNGKNRFNIILDTPGCSSAYGNFEHDSGDNILASNVDVRPPDFFGDMDDEAGGGMVICRLMGKKSKQNTCLLNDMDSQLISDSSRIGERWQTSETGTVNRGERISKATPPGSSACTTGNGPDLHGHHEQQHKQQQQHQQLQRLPTTVTILMGPNSSSSSSDNSNCKSESELSLISTDGANSNALPLTGSDNITPECANVAKEARSSHSKIVDSFADTDIYNDIDFEHFITNNNNNHNNKNNNFKYSTTSGLEPSTNSGSNCKRTLDHCAIVHYNSSQIDDDFEPGFDSDSKLNGPRHVKIEIQVETPAHGQERHAMNPFKKNDSYIKSRKSIADDDDIVEDDIIEDDNNYEDEDDDEDGNNNDEDEDGDDEDEEDDDREDIEMIVTSVPETTTTTLASSSSSSLCQNRRQTVTPPKSLRERIMESFHFISSSSSNHHERKHSAANYNSANNNKKQTFQSHRQLSLPQQSTSAIQQQQQHQQMLNQRQQSLQQSGAQQQPTLQSQQITSLPNQISNVSNIANTLFKVPLHKRHYEETHL